MRFSPEDFWGIKQGIRVGDRVKVVDVSCHYYSIALGKTGVVTEIINPSNDEITLYHIKFDDKTVMDKFFEKGGLASKSGLFFYKEELELI